MVEASDVAMSVEYKEFELKHNRHLNMMQENVSLMDWFQFWAGQEFAQTSFGRIQQGIRKRKE